MEAARARVVEARAQGVQYETTWYDQDYFAHHAHRNRAWAHLLAAGLMRALCPRRVLDIGCGAGLLVEAFRMAGVEAYGVDVSSDALSLAHDCIRPYLSVHDIMSEPLPFSDGSFDLITSIEVVEHLPTIDPVIAEASRLLREGGDVFIQTPLPGSAEAVDPTHINVQARPAWDRQWVHAGFLSRVEHLAEFEHTLPMSRLGRAIGIVRWWAPVRRHVARTGTRALYRKPSQFPPPPP